MEKVAFGDSPVDALLQRLKASGPSDVAAMAELG